jgi:hypothetical protein
MTSKDQVDAMANILAKVGAAAAGKPGKPGVSTSRDETAAMADVLRKLQAVSGNVAQTVVTESKVTPELGVAVQAKRTENGVSVSRYDIRTDKKQVQEGIGKTFYQIVDNRNGRVVYDDLGLFETAMGVVKHLLYTKDENRLNRLLDLDREYVGAMMELYSCKSRLKRLNENSVQYDVTTAKYSNARTRLSAAKIKILKAL